MLCVQISDVTDKILPRIEDWQNRPLDEVYPILYIDAIHYSVRDNGVIRKLAAYPMRRKTPCCRSLDDILAFIEGRDDDIDRNTPGKNKNPRSIFTCFYLKAPSKIISANLTFRSLTAPDNSNIPLVPSVTIKVKVFS